MSLAIDTDVLIPWLVRSARRHVEARSFIDAIVHGPDARIALAPQVCWEFLHVVTDQRRFERPCTMVEASDLIQAVWRAPETERLAGPAGLVPRVLELMRAHGLGRKRILDTALAATLESSGVRRLATYNVAHYACFDFLEPVAPGN